MAVKKYTSSATIRGKTYAYGASFVCYAANRGNAESEGTGGGAAALVKGDTYYFKGYAIDTDTSKLTAYPYLIADSLGNTRGWYKDNVFPYATYSVTYSANGGSGAPAKQTKTYGSNLTLTTAKPTRSGYTFQGWATSASGGVVYNPGGTYSTNAAVTLYAVWKANTYTVSYNANGGTGAPANQTKTHGVNLVLSSSKPTRTGYSFQGWATSSGGGVAYNPGGTYSSNSGVTLYAVWKANTYTVSYNANGGTGAPANQTKTYGVNLVLSSTKPTRTNYSFQGWGTSANATTVAYKAGGTYSSNSAITLYAIWTLDYVKPRISSFVVSRCDSSGTVMNDGTCALVKCNWATDRTVSSIIIYWKLSTQSSYSNSIRVTASGTSGSVNTIIGSGSLAAISTYDIKIVVADGNGSSEATKTLASQTFTIHAKPGGDGVAFGKTAELSGVADFGFDAKFNKPVYGKALGMDKLPQIPAGADLNNYMEPGCYAIGMNETAAQIKCGGVTLGSNNTVPPAVAGRLEVWSSTGSGILLEKWSNMRQRFVPYNSANPTWERDIARGPDNVWNYYAWWKSTLSPDISNRIYHEQNVLATTGMLFTAGHSVTLSEPISKQMHGIVLVFCAYADGAVQNYDFISYYVPKQLIAELSGKGHSFPLMRIDCVAVSVKFLYIDDTRVWGDDRNGKTGTGSNISYKNNGFVLRYIYGV